MGVDLVAGLIQQPRQSVGAVETAAPHDQAADGSCDRTSRADPAPAPRRDVARALLGSREGRCLGLADDLHVHFLRSGFHDVAFPGVPVHRPRPWASLCTPQSVRDLPVDGYGARAVQAWEINAIRCRRWTTSGRRE